MALLEIVPIGTGSASLSDRLAQVATVIDQSGLDYRVGPMGTTVEGEWDQIMALAKRCHDVALQSADRIMMTIQLNDRKDTPGAGRITSKVRSLEAKVGKALKK